MIFSRGIYAHVTLKGDSGVHYFADSRSVYDLLIDHFPHDVAEAAEGWTELACVGELYKEDGFEIEMIDD